MAKATLSVIARPSQYLVSRQAEAFTATPAEGLRQWWPTNVELSLESGAAFLKTLWNPATYAYGKDDYQVVASNGATVSGDKDLWIEGQGALGRGDKSVGFVGDPTYPATSPWTVLYDTTHILGRNRGVIFSFLWYRPANSTLPGFKFYPRIDHTKYTGDPGTRIYFCPFGFEIDQQMRLNVFEYPYDNYTYFETNPATALQKQYSHPLTVTPESLASRWHSIYVIPLSDDDVLFSSDIIKGGGFIYRSVLERANIFILPEGVPGIQSTTGGTGQVQITPLEVSSTGTVKSPKFSKSTSNNVYPTVKVSGWSPALIATNRGEMTEQTIASGATGTGGIRFDVYSVVTVDGTDTETLVDPTGGVEFKDFKIKFTLTASTHVSPVINSVTVDYGEDTETIADPTTDLSSDIIQLEGQNSDDGNVRFNVGVRNQDNVHGALAEKIMTELDVDIDGVDFAVLYTLNPGYDWLKTPTEGALELDWETGDGMVYLQRELCARHPAYDGQLLSDCLTAFMGRLGYDASRLDIEATPGIYLPKRKGKEPYQFKPEDGTPGADFLKKLKEWFASTYKMGFMGDGKFKFESIPLDVDGNETPTIARTYYADSANKPTSDDHVVYRNPKVELAMDNFFNEIWVVGEDKRNTEPLIAVYQDKASQSDKNSPRYVGRRLLMVLLTKLNRLDALEKVCNRLIPLHSRYGVRLSFDTRIDPALRKDDFIRLFEVGATWRITDINYDVSKDTMADSIINSGTPVIRGMKITAVQWPVAQ